MTIAFDTLKFADRLAAGGFTDEQAKTAAAALSDTFAESVAKKADLDQAVERLKASLDQTAERLTYMIEKQGAELTRAIDDLRAHSDRSINDLRTHADRSIERLEARIDASELRVTVKMGTMMVVMVGVMAALFKLLH